MLAAAAGLGALICAPCGAGAQSSFDDAALAAQMLDGHIRPLYTKFATASEAQRAALDAACKKPDAAATAAVKAAFRDAVIAWSRVEHLRFGPAVDGNRFERIMFWPDRQRIGERQVAQILEKKDQTALTVPELQKKSAAVQGLTALEMLLYAKGNLIQETSPEGQFACGYAAAIGGNVAVMAKEISDAWGKDGAFAQLWLKPGATNPAFKDGAGTSAELLKAFRGGLGNARDGKLLGALGLKRTRPDGPFAPKAKAPFDISGLAVAAIGANIEGVWDLYEAGGLADHLQREDAEKADLIKTELGKAMAIAKQVAPAGTEAFSDENSKKLLNMGSPLRVATRLGGDALEVVVSGKVSGFTVDDGD